MLSSVEKKKKINLGLGLVQGSQIIAVPCAVVHTWAGTQLWIQLEGQVFMVSPATPSLCSQPAFKSVSPLSPTWGAVWDLPSSAVPGWSWGPTIRAGDLSMLRRGCVGFRPVWSKPAHHLGTGIPSPLAGLCSCHLASGASHEHPEKSHPLLSSPSFAFPALVLSAAFTSLQKALVCTLAPLPTMLSALWGQGFCLSFSLVYLPLFRTVPGI